MARKITSVLCVFIGIAVIIMGVRLSGSRADHSVDDRTYSYKASDYDVKGATFGGDFYTYMYGGTDTIVDVLDDINKSVQTVVSAENGIYEATAANITATDALIDALYKVGGTVVMAVGLAIAAFGITAAGKAFSVAVPAKTGYSGPEGGIG